MNTLCVGRTKVPRSNSDSIKALCLGSINTQVVARLELLLLLLLCVASVANGTAPSSWEGEARGIHTDS